MGFGVGVLLFLRGCQVSCQCQGLVGERGGVWINSNELILQHTEISRHLPSKFAFSLFLFFHFSSNLPSSIYSYALCSFDMLFPETQGNALLGRS